MNDSSINEDDKDKVTSLAGLIKYAIRDGVPLFNKGDYKGCYEAYYDTAMYACLQKPIQLSSVGQMLDTATQEAVPLAEAGDYAQGAWVLRRCFDDILKLSKSTTSSALSSQKKNRRASDASMNLFRGSSMKMPAKSDMPTSTEIDVDSFTADTSTALTDDTDDDGYWQDEKTSNTTDYEIGMCLADFNHILRTSIEPATHKRFLTGKTVENCFEGSEAVQVLTRLGLTPDRPTAVMKCNMLLAGSFIVAVSKADAASFKDGTHLYRFSEREEMKATLDKLLVAKGSPPEGSPEAQLVIGLKAALDLPLGGGEPGEGAKYSGASHLQLPSQSSPEQEKGVALAQKAQKAEQVIDIQDRTYLLKTYEKCLVGKDSVTKLVEAKICPSKEDAIEFMKELCDVGLIHHVVRDHGFENKQLFYRFTSTSDLRKALDAIATLPSSEALRGTELTRRAALVTRYQQHVGDLDVTSILNNFFGCDDKEGWDVVDLQNWRNNMKRWGFGRREDQDDAMVEKLAPLALNVGDPDTWHHSLSEKEKEEWTSPWGILAQIAIFDQVPRSAFRGTPDAFKWDPLAIKASRLAIELGYLETAYKSTLNQFLILLPLEHSEDWEDQKLGVHLLLKLLSTIAIQDEGLSEYEIVKRMEFSKRLSTAFLEHAQVIAKFKRYPHRNRPLGRKATLEERVWLASDLVPIWAKSQNPDDASKNVIQLPVIPLKKLTRR